MSGRSRTVSLPLNAGTPRAAPGRLPILQRWIDARGQRPQPALLVRPVANARNDQQVPGARGGDVGQPHALGLVARRFELLCSSSSMRRPPAELDRAQARASYRGSARPRRGSACSRCPPGSPPGTRGPSPCAPSSGARRRCPPRGSAPQALGARSAASRSSSTKPRNDRPPSASYWRASSAICRTLASTCSPPRHSTNPACARVASISRPIVSATGRWLRSAIAGRAACRARRRPAPARAASPRARRRDGTPCRAVIGEQLLLADREERAAQRGEHRRARRRAIRWR